MSLLAQISTAMRVGREVAGAWNAAEAALDAGHGPLVALRAFAAASENQLDDEAVVVLEDALTQALTICGSVVDVAAALSTHGPAAENSVQKIMGAVLDVGYAVGDWRHTLQRWRDEVEA